MGYPFWKRALDVFGSILGIFFLALIFPVVAMAVKLEFPNEPILVKLPRISRGKTIYIYKFRNMIPGADKLKPSLLHLNERNDGPLFKIRNDPRVTRVGRFLRKTRIDELPQFFNVLKGELALVGPRPHEPEEISAYPNEFKHIVLSKAGATGLSQVSGASSLPFMKELQLDDYYLKHANLFLDLKILFKSAFILFFDSNAV